MLDDPMVVLWQLLAAIAYLAPPAIWAAWRLAGGGKPGATPEERAGRLAVELAVGVALDLLSVLALTRLMPLGMATLVSRCGWTAAGSGALARAVRRGWRPGPPSPAAWRWGATLAVVAAGGLLLSLTLSRPCQVWDREWHIPLTTALRGQRLPFMNVYDPQGGLYYHFAGDVQAAMLQALSGGRLHASLALSLAHDLMFAVLAVNVVSFMRRAGVRSALLGALVFVAVVIAGPVTLLRHDPRKLESGFAIVNYLTLSFRPHVPLAYLFELAFVEVAMSALLSVSVARRTSLMLLSAALVVTDESSLGMLGLALGTLWLVEPSVLGPRRRDGALTLALLLGAMVAASALFIGAIGPGAPHYDVALVSPRAPGYASPPLPLSGGQGASMLLQDLLPTLGVLVGLVALAVWRRDRAVRAFALFFAALLISSVLALTVLDFEHKPVESHRFVTALFVVSPLLAAMALARPTARTSPAALGRLPALAMLVPLALGCASTLAWLASGVSLRQCGHKGFGGFATDRLYTLDCRSEVDAHLGERTAPAYVDAAGFYLWAGCHPLFAAAAPPAPGEHKVKVGGPRYGAFALAQQHERLRSTGAPLTIACLTAPTAGPHRDPVCGRALALPTCASRGPDFTVCTADEEARDRLLGAWGNHP